MKRTSRILAVLLLAALLLPSCAAGNEKTDDTTTPPATDTTAVEETTTADPNDRSNVKDNVPDGLKFEGETVRILYRGSDDGKGNIEIYDVRGTDNVGDYVTDGVYERNRKTEERLGVTLEIIPSNAGNLSAESAFIRQLVVSGSGEYDYIVTTGNTNITNSLNIYLRDLANLPYADFDSPWWWREPIEALSLDGKTYNYIYGDGLIYNYIQTGVMYYNKAIYENIWGDPDAMYETVMDGKWTIDKLTELTAAAYNDANGDGVENEGDRFGAMKTQNQGEETPHFFQGFDIEMYHRDDEGNLVIEFDKERSVTAIDKLGRFYNETTGVYHSPDGIDASDKYFAQDFCLFFPARLARAISPNLREMESPYGILPYPKLDEEQKEYISLIHDSSSNFSVLKTISDKRFEIVGAVLEATCAESYRSVMPQFLETALKLKYSQDMQSGKVIDIVIEGVTKNTLMEYKTFSASIASSALIDQARAGKNNFASAYAKLQPAAQKTWDKAVAKLLSDQK